VKALIDAGTCASVTTTSTICGSSSISSAYYETFVYGSYRVVITAGVPSHAAEYNQTKATPNTRCNRVLDNLNKTMRVVHYSKVITINNFMITTSKVTKVLV
jgi:hypothetical protein